MDGCCRADLISTCRTRWPHVVGGRILEQNLKPRELLPEVVCPLWVLCRRRHHHHTVTTYVATTIRAYGHIRGEKTNLYSDYFSIFFCTLSLRSAHCCDFLFRNCAADVLVVQREPRLAACITDVSFIPWRGVFREVDHALLSPHLRSWYLGGVGVTARFSCTDQSQHRPCFYRTKSGLNNDVCPAGTWGWFKFLPYIVTCNPLYTRMSRDILNNHISAVSMSLMSLSLAVQLSEPSYGRHTINLHYCPSSNGAVHVSPNCTTYTVCSNLLLLIISTPLFSKWLMSHSQIIQIGGTRFIKISRSIH